MREMATLCRDAAAARAEVRGWPMASPPSDAAGEAVVGGVGGDPLFHVAERCGVVGDEQFGAWHACVVFECLDADSGGHDGVVGGAGGQPGGRRSAEVRCGFPYR